MPRVQEPLCLRIPVSGDRDRHAVIVGGQIAQIVKVTCNPTPVLNRKICSTSEVIDAGDLISLLRGKNQQNGVVFVHHARNPSVDTHDDVAAGNRESDGRMDSGLLLRLIVVAAHSPHHQPRLLTLNDEFLRLTDDHPVPFIAAEPTSACLITIFLRNLCGLRRFYIREFVVGLGISKVHSIFCFEGGREPRDDRAADRICRPCAAAAWAMG